MKSFPYIKTKYKKDKIALLGHSWGSILGTEYIKKYPENILCYIGVGAVISFIEGEKIGFDKVRAMIDESGDKKDLKQIESLGEYPYNTVGNYDTKPVLKVRALQSKYGLAVNINEAFKIFRKSPIFKLLDIFAISIGFSINKELWKTVVDYDTSRFLDYTIPMYCITGEDDWQVSSVLAEKYYHSINAPKKGFYWIKDAGHVPNVDNNKDFNHAITEILNHALKIELIV